MLVLESICSGTLCDWKNDWLLLVVGCWLLVVGCWLLVVGYWLLVVGYFFTSNYNHSPLTRASSILIPNKQQPTNNKKQTSP